MVVCDDSAGKCPMMLKVIRTKDISLQHKTTKQHNLCRFQEPKDRFRLHRGWTPYGGDCTQFWPWEVKYLHDNIPSFICQTQAISKQHIQSNTHDPYRCKLHVGRVEAPCLQTRFSRHHGIDGKLNSCQQVYDECPSSSCVFHVILHELTARAMISNKVCLLKILRNTKQINF